MTPQSPDADRRLPDEIEIAVIGSGFAGLCMGAQLRRAGREDFVILERDDTLGGTWRANHYPGCACDVPSHLYSFSFHQNAEWSRKFPSQPELLAYTLDVVRQFDLARHIHTSTAVTEARWDEAAQRWCLQTSRGPLRTRVLVMGTGALNRPVIPELPGLKDFQGAVFHSAHWDHALPLAGRRVAVIGTGASAIQFVPELARSAAQLDVYQRTAPWILPRPDRAIRPWERALLRRSRLLQNLYRGLTYLQYESRALAFVHFPQLGRVVQKVALAHLHRQTPGRPDLHAKLTPDYRLGCKRVLLSNDYHRVFTQPHAALHHGAIQRVTAQGIVGRDGVERPADVIVFGTGFNVESAFSAMAVFGRQGQRLGGADGRAGIPEAYKGATVAGFPNLFMITGPNTGLGHNSMIYMIESGVAYILDALRQRARGAWHTAEPRAEVQQRFNAGLQQRLQGTVWHSGCRSWYLDSQGRNGTLWPGFTFSYRRLTRRFDAEHYRLEARLGAP